MLNYLKNERLITLAWCRPGAVKDNEVVMNLDKYVSVKYAKNMKLLAQVDHCRLKLELPPAETGPSVKLM